MADGKCARCGRCRTGGFAAGAPILPNIQRRNGRAWFLRIVRNTSWYWCSRHFNARTDLFDKEQHSLARLASDPESLLLQIDDGVLIERATSHLPDRFRQLLVLREFSGLSYREVAEVLALPMGSVMSGLSRARQAFRGAINDELKRSGMPPRTHGETRR
jgi:RNA polymerase sigma factor (sigma-70 family)